MATDDSFVRFVDLENARGKFLDDLSLQQTIALNPARKFQLTIDRGCHGTHSRTELSMYEGFSKCLKHHLETLLVSKLVRSTDYSICIMYILIIS